MTRRRSDPLRALADTERTELLHLSRSWSAPAGQVARANALLAVADGHSYTAAAHMAGRHQGDTIARSRFNHEGLAAMVPRHGGGPRVRYGDDQRRRILAEVARAPDRERDGTATWSLTTLRAALRRADDGLPAVSTFTLWRTLRDAGLSWQQDRTWCFTGVAVRRRKQGGVITVTDPDAAAKKA
jgi:transposase